MSLLVVSSYPPRRCGIGAYAHTQVARMRGAGETVTVLSPPDGEGDERIRFDGGRPFRRAVELTRPGDRILIHFQPALYFRPRAPLSKIGTSLGLLALVKRRPRTEILVHEADPPRWWRPDEILLTRAFRAAPLLLFHTEAERRSFERRFGRIRRARVVPHVDGVEVRGPVSRADARRRLELPAEARILVVPGFLHPGKGVDRAIRAVPQDALLYVVGSVKDPTPENVAYAAEVRRLAAADPRVELVERFVADEEFDAWVAAADAVILPYRRSWSSGVLARAQAIGTPAIVADVGGLGEQAGPSDVVVRSDAELAEAMAKVGHEVAS
ncbi:MAG TPA: glycosyltransferase [Actinomycetota bacterium]|nr:glycosyltransferase [Actinomycetota bacterium]